jgi:hypothetical protein
MDNIEYDRGTVEEVCQGGSTGWASQPLIRVSTENLTYGNHSGLGCFDAKSTG